MREVKISNPKPQGDWICLSDYLKFSHNWVKEEQKLIIMLDEKYKMPQLVKLQNEVVEMVNKCNDIAGIEIYYEEILIHQTIKTISQGVIQPQKIGDIETPMDERHYNLYNSDTPYLLKIN